MQQGARFPVTRCLQRLIGGFGLLACSASFGSTPETAQYNLPVVRVDTRHLDARTVGRELGRLWKSRFPELESQLDGLLARRLGRIAPQPLPLLPTSGTELAKLVESERAEFQGLASVLNLVSESRFGDGLLSADELMLVQILPDLGVYGSGSGFGVFGSLSTSGQPLIVRTLNRESDESAGRIPDAITIYERVGHTVVSVGIAGNLGITTGFNGSGLFVSILPALGVPAPPESVTSVESLALAVRRTLQTSEQIDTAVHSLSGGHYGVAHSLLIADREAVGVLEQPLAGEGLLRTAMSVLHPSMAWGPRESIAAVGCFALASMPSDCDDARHRYLWQHLRESAENYVKGRRLGLAELIDAMLQGERHATSSDKPHRGQILGFATNTADLVIRDLSSSTTGDPTRESVTQQFTDLLPLPKAERDTSLRWWWLWASIAILLVITLWVRFRSNPRDVPEAEADADADAE